MLGLYQFTKSNLRWLVGGLLLTFFSSFGQTFYISQFSKEIRESFQLSDGEFGMIYMVGTLASALTLVWVGKTVDRFPVANVAFFVLIFLAVACFGMANATSTLMLLVVIYGLRLFGQGMLTHTSQTAIGRWYSAERGRAISLTSLGHQLGEAIFPLIVLGTIRTVGWRQSWLISAGILVCVALPSIVLLMRVERKPLLKESDGRSGPTVRDWTRSEVIRDSMFWLLLLGILAPPMRHRSMPKRALRLPSEAKTWVKEFLSYIDQPTSRPAMSIRQL